MKSVNEVKYLPPCVFQGGKQRLANIICDIIEEKEHSDFVFYDLCCGGGSVSMEMLNRGHKVVMVDKGLFGLFWEKIAKNEFDLDVFKGEIAKLPSVDKIQEYLKDLSLKPVDSKLLPYQYLLLQAGAFGGKQIWVKDGKWQNNTFRSYWQPTETSNRRSPVQPMIPIPSTILQRVENLFEVPKGYITAYHSDIREVIDILNNDEREKVVYIDPPYMNSTKYYDDLDIYEIVNKINVKSLYISEGVELKGFNSVVLSDGRKKGNMNGNVKKKPVVERLNFR